MLKVWFIAFLLAACTEDQPATQPTSQGSAGECTGDDCENDNQNGDSQSPGTNSGDNAGGSDSGGGIAGILASLFGGGGTPAPSEPSGDQKAAIINQVDRFGDEPFQATRTNNTGHDMPEFECPGFSYLVGDHSYFENHDRTYHPRCGFFEDGWGRPTIKVKSECEWSETTNAAREGVRYRCPADKFLAGIASTWNGQQNDRVWKYQCCAMRNWDNEQVKVLVDQQGTPACTLPTPVGFGENPTREVNQPKQPVDFKCARDNEVLVEIRSDYRLAPGEDGDRRFSYTCCQIGVQ